MNLNKLVPFRDNPGLYQLPFSVTSCELYKNEKSINDFIAIPVDYVSQGIKKNADISISDESGYEIATLTFTKELGEVDINQLTENQFIAYLTEADGLLPFYKFEKNYVVVKKNYYDKYIESYRDTSSIWGGFIHPHPNVSVNSTYEKEIVSLVAIKDIDLGESYFIENSLRAIMQVHAFERYLKFYHLLELNFDYDLVKRIRGLNLEMNSNLIGSLLNEYSNKEFERLSSVLKVRCKDLSAILPHLQKVFNYEDKAVEIFYTFGKETNPLKDIDKFNDLKGITSFSYTDVKSKFKNLSTQQQYEQLIYKLIAYWIYRVRCCIAHNKIGEYVMTKNDEEFVVEFAEPLLKQVLIECFKTNTNQQIGFWDISNSTTSYGSLIRRYTRPT